MRSSSLLFVFCSLFVGCDQSAAVGQDKKPIIAQCKIANIACGPCSLFNRMSHGGEALQGILHTLSQDKTPKQTVDQLIATYGKRQSATKPSVKRYGPHNGGVGSVNLMLMANEILADHLKHHPL